MEATRCGNWYQGVVGAAGRFMPKWHRSEADKSWLIHATVSTKNSNKSKLEGGRGRGGARTEIQLRTNAESKWYMVWHATGLTFLWSVFKYYGIALNKTVSGNVFLCVYSSRSKGEARTWQ